MARAWVGTFAPLVAPVEVRLVDERLTTVSATAALRASGKSAKQGRSVVDQAAAVALLQGVLDARAGLTLVGWRRDRPPRRAARPSAPARRAKRRGPGRLLAVLVVLLLTAGLAGGGYVAVKKVFGGSSAEDYAGEGTGEAVVQIMPGDVAGDVGARLVEKGVVASRAAFFEVALADPRSTGLQPGFYKLRQQMSAASALDLLLDPASRLVGRVTVPEGLTVAQTLDTLAKGTEIPLEQLQAAAKDTGALGLPAYAKGSSRASCSRPRTRSSPARRPCRCSARWSTASSRPQPRPTSRRAPRRSGGRRTRWSSSPASSSARSSATTSTRKVARVVYNRLDQGIPLGIDAAVLFGVGKTAGGELTRSDLAKDTPYENRRKTRAPAHADRLPGRGDPRGRAQPGGRRHPLLRAGQQGRHRRSSPNDYNAFLRQRDKSRAEGVF